jgi:hypothetical protein
MTLTASRILSLATLLVAGVGCHRTTPSPAPPVSLAGDWTLMELDTQPGPTGAGGRHATLHFETELTLFGVSGSLARFARATP